METKRTPASWAPNPNLDTHTHRVAPLEMDLKPYHSPRILVDKTPIRSNCPRAQLAPLRFSANITRVGCQFRCLLRSREDLVEGPRSPKPSMRARKRQEEKVPLCVFCFLFFFVSLSLCSFLVGHRSFLLAGSFSLSLWLSLLLFSRAFLLAASEPSKDPVGAPGQNTENATGRRCNAPKAVKFVWLSKKSLSPGYKLLMYDFQHMGLDTS